MEIRLTLSVRGPSPWRHTWCTLNVREPSQWRPNYIWAQYNPVPPYYPVRIQWGWGYWGFKSKQIPWGRALRPLYSEIFFLSNSKPPLHWKARSAPATKGGRINISLYLLARMLNIVKVRLEECFPSVFIWYLSSCIFFMIEYCIFDGRIYTHITCWKHLYCCNSGKNRSLL